MLGEKWSKIFFVVMFLNCLVIEISVIVLMFRQLSIAVSLGAVDWSPMITLIGAVISQTLSYLFYIVKSGKENTNKNYLAFKEQMAKLQMAEDVNEIEFDEDEEDDDDDAIMAEINPEVSMNDVRRGAEDVPVVKPPFDDLVPYDRGTDMLTQEEITDLLSAVDPDIIKDDDEEE